MPDTKDQFLFAYPAEVPLYYSRVSLRKYSRNSPGSASNLTTQKVIRLPLPTQLLDDYNMSVSSTSMGLIPGAAASLKAISDQMAAGATTGEMINKTFKAGMDITKQMNLTALQMAALVPGISDTGVAKYISSQAGVVRNPHLTTVFDGVQLRHFQFDWKLSATSQEEAQNINQIIKTVKMYMHPQITGSGFALEYPYLATVDFQVGAVNNSTLPNVRDSFITSMKVNNASGGGISFYRDGNPISIDLSMSFQEIDILTRDDFTTSGSS